MFETYRMLGRLHEADLTHEAEKLARGADARRRSRNGRRLYRVVLVHVRARALLRAFTGDARPDDLGEPEEIRTANGDARVDLAMHVLRPGLGPDESEPEADPVRGDTAFGGTHARA